MVLIREYDPFSGHMPVLPVRELVITPLDEDGSPIGEPLHLDGTEVSVQFAGPTFGALPPISTTRSAVGALEVLQAPAPVSTPPVEPAPQAAVEPPKRKRPRRRRPSAAEVEASIKDMDR